MLHMCFYVINILQSQKLAETSIRPLTSHPSIVVFAAALDDGLQSLDEMSSLSEHIFVAV